MAKTYTFSGLRESFKDMYLIVEVTERDDRGFASQYKVIGEAKSKREIEKKYELVKKKNPDSYIHQTFRDSKNCFRFKTINGVLQKVPAYSASECAELFRHYYGV